MAETPASRTTAQARTAKATVSEVGVVGDEERVSVVVERASGITGCIAGVAGSAAAGGRTGPAVGAGSEPSAGRATRSVRQIRGATAATKPGLAGPRTDEQLRDAAAWFAIAEREGRTLATA